MSLFPKDPKKMRSRLRSYERSLRQEKQQTCFIGDGYGRRYLLGPLYMLLGNNDGAIKSFTWLDETFPNDTGEPMQYLCWTLAVYRSRAIDAAVSNFCQTMLSNLYLLPALLGIEQAVLDIWHGSNFAEKMYLDYVPPEIFELWDEDALSWASETYSRPDVQSIRERYIAIYRQLATEARGPKRSRLVEEAFQLKF
jgi:hypothetical protein